MQWIRQHQTIELKYISYLDMQKVLFQRAAFG